MLNDTCVNIAILGATGHIAKNLIKGLSATKHYQLNLFARSTERLSAFLKENNISEQIHICDYEQFQQEATYDVIINCIGVGNPQDLVQNPFSVFQITEQYDNLILQYIQKKPATVYINLSSGAAYGSDFEAPATRDKILNLNVNNLTVKDYYGIAKLNMEAKHRSLHNLKIVDLRVFGFFSSYIDLESKFLITEIIDHVQTGEILYTSSEDIKRDYVHPEDFLQLVELCFNKNIKNDVYDVYSRNPLSKFEMLNYFADEHGLKFEIKVETAYASITGSKTNYYSNNDNAMGIGYQPRYTSLQSVRDGYQQFRMRNNDENN
ncbi:NAD-dependent epimerase/dehydratase family protein [Paenibacillus sp. B-A-8]|uniref:NAD-dependent epimerase/dehydratase family protein n=1 Tax=Paenibacillus sp. B-A-8 TaxID=3400419 RepID=UPI003B01F4AE